MKRIISFLVTIILMFSTNVYAEESENNITYIEDREKIARIISENKLNENPDDVFMIIYVEAEKEDNAKTPRLGNDYEFRNIVKSVKAGKLLRSSDYVYPGGEMTLSGKIKVKYGTQVGLAAEYVSAAIGINVYCGYAMSDTVYIQVPERVDKVTANAHVKVNRYDFDVYENDLFIDDYLGTGYLEEPIGVIISLRRPVTECPTK